MDIIKEINKRFPTGTDKKHIAKLKFARLYINKLDSKNKRIAINSIVKQYGVKVSTKAFKGMNRPVIEVNKSLKRFNKVRNNIAAINKKIYEITDGQAIIAHRTRVLGSGVSGVALECINYKKCPLKWRNAVVKISDPDAEWKNEVKYLKKLTKYMKNNPNKDPIAPKIYGSFKLGEYGFIVMQNANYVFPGARRSLQWMYVGYNPREYLSHLPALKTAMDKLHELGIGHGDMHGFNIWMAEVKKDKYKFFFTDFGKSYKYKNIKRFTETNSLHGYNGLMNNNNKIKIMIHPKTKEGLMNNDKVFKSFLSYKKKLNTINKK